MPDDTNQAAGAPADKRPDAGAGGAGGPPGGARGYKRSWKNLLINRRYQLRFTLFMVGLAGVLMGLLGWWVMRVASDATNVAIGRVRGEPCPKVADLMHGEDTPPAAVNAPPPAARPAVVPEDLAAAADDPDLEHSRRAVQIDESSMTITQSAPTDYVNQVLIHWTCELDQDAKITSLARGHARILYVLILTGLLLMVGLAAYGIKMTHKVAGPLFKVTLYFNKMREGRLDKVYNLRKGDQLVDFYEHFKHAHDGVVALETADVAQLRAVLAVADAEGLAGRTPEIDVALAALRAALARKEKSLE